MVRRLLQRAEDRGLPAGPEQYLRTQALVFFTTVLFALGLVWGVSHLLSGRVIPATYYFIEVGLVVATAAFALRTGQLRFSTHLVLAIGYSSVIVATALTGGLAGANIAPFFMILVAPVFLLGPSGFWWAAASLILAGAFEAAHWQGIQFPINVESPQLDAVATWGVSGAVVAVFLAFFESSRLRAWCDLQLTNQALSDSEQKYRSLVDNAHEAIVVVQDGHLVFHNPQLRALTGLDADTLQARVFTQLVLPTDQPRVTRTMGRVLGGDLLPILHDVQLQGAQGPCWVDLGVTRVPWRGRNALLVLLADQTEEHQARAQLDERETQLRQAQKMEAVGRLAGGVAHDFNNQLTSMMGLADLLMLALGQGDPNYRDAQEIKQIARKAADLTHQLLAFSRKQKLSPVLIDPNELVESSTKMLRRLVGEDVRLVLDLDPDLPTVRADKGQLDQVLMNLVVNARDAMPKGGEVVVSTHLRHFAEATPEAPPGDYARISVSDTGTGMSAEVRELVFEPFFTTRKLGTGLGLSVVYGIVRQHGGWMEVDSAPGQGSTFHVFLPTSTEAPEERSGEADTSGPLGTGQRILVVEDAPEVRTMATRFLSTHGYRTVQVATAEDALELLERDPHFSLIFTDVVLPGQSGVQLATHILTRLPGTRVLLSSGYSDERSRWEEIRDLRYPFVAKPYSVDSLLEAVHEALHQPVSQV